jgi:hypothetical protein
MANVLEIQPAQWEQIAQPQNVLVLPSLQPLPKKPLVPINNFKPQAWEFVDPPCAGGSCDLLMHDATSGWWKWVAGTGCDGVSGTPVSIANGYPDPIPTVMYFAALVAGTDLLTDTPFTPACDWPGWVESPGACVWDGWTIVCDNTLIVLDLQLGTQTAACLPGQTLGQDGICRFPDPPRGTGGRPLMPRAYDQVAIPGGTKMPAAAAGRLISVPTGKNSVASPSLLNPTLKGPPIPVNTPGCGCGEDEETALEELTGGLAGGASAGSGAIISPHLAAPAPLPAPKPTPRAPLPAPGRFV